MRNMAVLHSPAFSYPLPVLVRVLFNLLIFKGKILYYNKYTKRSAQKNALITYPMYQRIFYNIPITFLVQLHKQFAFNFLSRDFVLSQ